jgi:hypothetical protein
MGKSVRCEGGVCLGKGIVSQGGDEAQEKETGREMGGSHQLLPRGCQVRL